MAKPKLGAPKEKDVDSNADVNTEVDNNADDFENGDELEADDTKTGDDVELDTETVVVETPDVVVDNTPEITIEVGAQKEAPTKNVKICPKKDHSCSVGGVRYHFVAGVQTIVPEEVKRILSENDLLRPL